MPTSTVSDINPDLLERFRLKANFRQDHTIQDIQNLAQNDNDRRATQTWQRARSLGEGAFSQVFQEKHEDDHGDWQYRAVKICQKARMSRAGVDYRRELTALALLSSSKYSGFFLNLNGWWMDDTNVYIALEYLQKGDLSAYIEEGLTEEGAREVTEDVLNGLHTLHDMGFSHRDIKPQNILVVQKPPESQKWWVKIADFGISKRIMEDSDTSLHTFIGTRPYCAPEILGYLPAQHQSLHYTNKVDMWSLGCVLFNIGTRGQMPFTDSDLVKYCSGILRFNPTERIMTLGYKGMSLTIDLLQWNPDLRPTAAEALNSSWFIASKSPQRCPSPAEVPTSRADTQWNYNSFMQSCLSDTTCELETASTHSIEVSHVVNTVAAIPKLPYEGIIQKVNDLGSPTTIRRYLDSGRPKPLIFAVGLLGKSFAVGCTWGYVDVWLASEKSFMLTRTIRPHERDISSVALPPFGRTGASSESSPGTRSFKIWDVETGEILHELSFGPPNPAGPTLEFDYDGEHIFAGYYRSTIIRWSIKSGQIEEVFDNSGSEITGIKLSPYSNSVMATIQAGGNIKLWDLPTKRRYPVTIDADSDQGGRSVQFGGPGTLEFYAATWPGEVNEWCLEELKTDASQVSDTGKHSRKRRIGVFPELKAIFSSRTVLSAHFYAADVVHDGSYVLVWNVMTCEPLGRLQGTSESKIIHHIFWRDSSHLATVHEDGTVEIWSWPFSSEDYQNV